MTLTYLLVYLSSLQTIISSPSSRQEEARIVHGQETVRGERPYQVSVQLNYGDRLVSSKPEHFCGGALISPKYVLSAAHCVKSVNSPRKLKIVGGTNDLTDRSSPTWAVKNIFRGNYNDKTKVNDLALLELDTKGSSRSLRSSKAHPLVPVPLCRDSFEPQGRNCTVSGWGHLKAKGSSVPDHLREVSVTVLHDSICQKMLNGYPWDPTGKTMLCAGGKDKDACQGDSGGPMVCEDDNKRRCIAGIVSWGVGCATEGIPGVYTNVRHYNQWIMNHVGAGKAGDDTTDDTNGSSSPGILSNIIQAVKTTLNITIT